MWNLFLHVKMTAPFLHFASIYWCWNSSLALTVCNKWRACGEKRWSALYIRELKEQKSIWVNGGRVLIYLAYGTLIQTMSTTLSALVHMLRNWCMMLHEWIHFISLNEVRKHCMFRYTCGLIWIRLCLQYSVQFTKCGVWNVISHNAW